jgi:hypothetical protein
MFIAKYSVLYQMEGVSTKSIRNEEVFLCGPLRISAISALSGLLTQRSQRYAEDRREESVCAGGGVASEHGRADGGAVKSKFSGDDFGGFEARLKGATFYFGDDGVKD